MSTTSKSLTQRLAAWAAAPVTTPMDLPTVALTAAFVTTIVVAWLFVLRHIVRED